MKPRLITSFTLKCVWIIFKIRYLIRHSLAQIISIKLGHSGIRQIKSFSLEKIVSVVKK